MYDVDAILKVCSEPVILDIGAYTGNWAKAACERFPTARVYSVEADPEIYKKLVRNTKGLSIVPVNAAVNDEDGCVDFYSASSDKIRQSQSNSLFKEYIGGKSWAKKITRREVKSCTLSSLCRDLGIDNIDLLKINCEGCEYKMFQSRDLSFLDFTQIIQLQLHGKNPIFASPCFRAERKSIKQKLIENGFELVYEHSPNILKGHTDQLWRRQVDG